MNKFMEHYKKLIYDILEVFGINIFAFAVWMTNLELFFKIVFSLSSLAYLYWRWWSEYKTKETKKKK